MADKNTKYQVIIKRNHSTDNETLSVTQGSGDLGQPLRIKATPGVRYELQEIGKQGRAPDTLKVKRLGKDLHITFEGDRASDIIIEKYYDVMPEGYNALIGRASSSIYYAYIPEDPEPAGLIPSLRDGGNAVNVALGNSELASASAAVAAFGFLPWLAGGAALVGVAAAAGGGGGGGGGNGSNGGGGGGSDTTPLAPKGTVSVESIHDGNASTNTITGSKDTGISNTDFVTSDNTLVVKGTASNLPAGNKPHVKITDSAGTTIIEQDVSPDASGHWEFDIAKALSDGKLSKAEVKDGELKDGRYNIVVDAVDGNGTKVSSTIPLVIDTSPTKNENGVNPDGTTKFKDDINLKATAEIGSINDPTAQDAQTGSRDTGASASDFITNDTTLCFKGSTNGFSNAEGGGIHLMVVQKSDPAQKVVVDQYLTPDASGQWSFDNQSKQLANGDYAITADIVDKAGNVLDLAKRVSKDLKIDTIAPDALNFASSGEGSSSLANDFKDKTNNKDGSESYAFLTADGDKIQSISGTYGRISLVGSRWTYTLNDGIDAAHESFTYSVSDAAGNSDSATITIDLSRTPVPVVGIASPEALTQSPLLTEASLAPSLSLIASSLLDQIISPASDNALSNDAPTIPSFGAFLDPGIADQGPEQLEMPNLPPDLPLPLQTPLSTMPDLAPTLQKEAKGIINLVNGEVDLFNVKLSDLLESPTNSQGVHQLKILGDAVDVINLENILGSGQSGDSWESAGMLEADGQTYSAYQYASNHSLQVLIDSHIAQSNVHVL